MICWSGPLRLFNLQLRFMGRGTGFGGLERPLAILLLNLAVAVEMVDSLALEISRARILSFSVRFLRGFVFSANLRNTCWQYCCEKEKSPRNTAKFPQKLRGEMNNSRLAEFSRYRSCLLRKPITAISRTLTSRQDSAEMPGALAVSIWGFDYNFTNCKFRKTLAAVKLYLARGMKFKLRFEIQC